LKLFGLGRLQRKPTATTFPSVSTVTALAESLHSPWKTEPVVTWRQSSAPVAPLYLTTVKSPRLPRLLPAATTFPARSTATALAEPKELVPEPSMTWRHSSVPSAPENLITVKSPKLESPPSSPGIWFVTPATTTFPAPSRVIALAELPEPATVPLMIRRQISAPVTPLYLITVKAEPLPLFVEPAAITLPATSTTTELPKPELMLVCQAPAPEQERIRLYAPNTAMTNVLFVFIVTPFF